MDYLNTYQCMDAIALLRILATASVDLILVDPPYHTTQVGFDKRTPIDWVQWWKEANRVLRPAGVVCVFASGPFTFQMHATNPRNWRYNLVWEKTRYSRFLDANRRPLQAHEDILVFCRKPGKATYNPQMVYTPNGATRQTLLRKDDRSQHYAQVRNREYTYTDFRHPGTVLKYASGNHLNNTNPTQKPVPLIRWMVRSYSNPGDIVVDTCAGSGTTACACIEEGRHYICSDDDPEQCQLGNERITKFLTPIWATQKQQTSRA